MFRGLCRLLIGLCPGTLLARSFAGSDPTGLALHDAHQHAILIRLGAVLGLLLLWGATTYATEAEPDSTEIERPSFSMTPT